jgi:hypothetical protein
MELARAAPPLKHGCFDVGVESDPVVNAFGGRYGTFALAGSTASVDQDPAEGRRVLRFRCERGGGACGLWIHLYETTNQLKRTLVDASDISRLVFWARIGESGTGVSVSAADAALGRREDAARIGEMKNFVRGPELDGGWSRVEVPLDALPPSLARDSLATFVFEAGRTGVTEIELAGLQLCAREAEGAPFPEVAGAPSAPVAPPHRALWVWNTREILGDAQSSASFLDFVRERGIDRVFLQLVPAEGQSPVAGFVPFDGAEVGALIADLHERGAEVYALDGDPAYALPANHAGVLRTVSALLAHNRASPPERRFHGVRYDIEPYLLPDFRGSGRDALVTGYLDLVSAISSVTSGSLAFGVDLPFWLDAPEEKTGEPVSITWRGTRRTLLDHLVRQVDDIAVMAYRTSAYGADGSLAQAHGELEAAAAAGIDAYVGLETETLADEDAYAFRGTPGRGLPPSGGGPWIVMAPVSPGEARVWLVPAGEGQALRGQIEAAGVPSETVFHWKSDPPSRIAAERLSFQRLGQGRLDLEEARLVRELMHSPAFAGVAYHHYRSLARLGPSGTPDGSGMPR